MKTINLRSLLPLLVIVLAITSAFAFQNEAKDTMATTEIGWVDHPVPCSVPVQCDNAGSVICTVMYQGNLREVKGKENPTDNTCFKTLYRLNP